MKNINNIFKENGKWSIKRISGSVALLYCFAYPLITEPIEYVFDGFLMFAGFCIGLTVVNKHKSFKDEKLPTKK